MGIPTPPETTYKTNSESLTSTSPSPSTPPTTPQQPRPIYNPQNPNPPLNPQPIYPNKPPRPSPFKTTINTSLDNPRLSLYRLTIRLLQLSFALASGISYALSYTALSSTSSSTEGKTYRTNTIFALLVFALTILTLIIDALTIRYYRMIWSVEWVLSLFWWVVFALFYQAFINTNTTLSSSVGDTDVDIGRMKRAVWITLINTILWMISAVFSSVMCWKGVRASVRARLEVRRMRKERKRREAKGKVVEVELGDMECGTVRE